MQLARTRAPRRIFLGLAAAALLVGVGACTKDDQGNVKIGDQEQAANFTLNKKGQATGTDEDKKQQIKAGGTLGVTFTVNITADPALKGAHVKLSGLGLDTVIGDDGKASRPWLLVRPGTYDLLILVPAESTGDHLEDWKKLLEDGVPAYTKTGGTVTVG